MEFKLRPVGFMEFFCKTTTIRQLRKWNESIHFIFLTAWSQYTNELNWKINEVYSLSHAHTWRLSLHKVLKLLPRISRNKVIYWQLKRVIFTGWNDKIVALEKTWFHFRLMKTVFFCFVFFFLFFFFFADHQLVGQLCTNPKSDRSLLSYQKVTQCSSSEIGDAPLYNSCSLPIQVMTKGPLPAPSKCISGLPRITGTYPGWWKESFQLRLWSLVWFQVRATSCHHTSSKSAWKCTWICWRVWWSPGAIRCPVADSGCSSRTRCRPTNPKRPRLSYRRSATTLYPSLTGPTSSPDLNLLDYFVWSYVENITNMTSHNTEASLIAAIRRVFAELPPALAEKACS